MGERAGTDMGRTDGAGGRAVRVRNRWGEGDRLRTEILEAASRLLSELDDEDGVTIRGVARATGIAPASIYPHFGDREALMDGLLTYEYERLGALLDRADAAAADADPVERVRAQLRAYCDFAVANPGHYRILFRRRARGPAPPGAQGPVHEIVARFATALERCAGAGHPLRLPASRAGTVVFVATHGRVALFHSYSAERNVTRLHAFIDEVLSLVVDLNV
jgi:AcrR family transcriptional regulator